jgi:hypothetical protein
MKADIAVHFSDRFFIALAGVSQYAALRLALDELRRIDNITRVAIAWDMDQFDNPAVMESLREIQRIITGAGFDACRLNWNREYKGIDNYLKWVRSCPDKEDV